MTEPPSRFHAPNPYRLYRNPRRALVGGVCAGMADYLAVPPWFMRLAMATALVMTFLPVLAAYCLAAVLLKPRPPQLYVTTEEDDFWRLVNRMPKRTAAALSKRYQEFERRLEGLENCVMSRETELNRGLRDLDGESR